MVNIYVHRPRRVVVVGSAWGDTGKGAVVDEEISRIQERDDGKRVITGRFQGACNAGHTIYIRQTDGSLKKIVTHGAPSGIAAGADIFFGPHFGFDPAAAIDEIKKATGGGDYDGRIMISERAGVLMEYHKVLDGAKESNGNGIGSTKRGIGPFYMDNVNRTTRLTFADYTGPKFHDRLRDIIEEKSDQLRIAGIDRLDSYLEELIATHDPLRKELAPFRENLLYRMQEYMRNGHHIVLEGAQGANLHVDMGTLPHVTASHLLAPEALASLGISRRDVLIYLAEKVYPTRVGDGELPTMMDDRFCNDLACDAGEIGASTGRDRRCGYPDWAIIRQNVMINDADGIYITRFDNVQGRDIKVGVGYVVNGQPTEEVPLYMDDIESVVWHDGLYNFHLFDAPKDLSTPEEVDADLRDKRQAVIDAGYEGLPRQAKEFIKDHDEFVGCPTKAVRIGPARGETVYIEKKD